MCQVRALCPDLAEEIHGLLQGEVGVVAAALHTVDGHAVQPLQLFYLLVLNELQVGHISDFPEAVTQHRQLLFRVVPALDRHHRGPERQFFRARAGLLVMVALRGLPDQGVFQSIAVQLERHGPVLISDSAPDDVHLDFRRAGIEHLRECVGIFPLERLEDIALAVDVHRLLLQQVEGAHVIQSSGVVLVIMGEQYGIQMAYVGAQHLVAEVRTRVHEYVQSVAVYQRRGPQPLVARVGRSADGAAAAYHRHSLGGAGTQEEQSCLFFHIPISSRLRLTLDQRHSPSTGGQAFETLTHISPNCG